MKTDIIRESVIRWLIITLLAIPGLLVLNCNPDKMWLNFMGLGWLFLLSMIFGWKMKP